jgi:multidrug efflux pump subunit AcrA (membrane-fusion protein)
MEKKNIFKRSWNFILAHKIWSVIALIVVIGGGYYWYKTASAANVTPSYGLVRVRNGNIVQTVTGTGQVVAANQISIQSQASGAITSINVSVGQHVNTGDLIATIDDTNALNSLNSAKLAYAKLTEAPKATDLSNAQNSVAGSYGTAFSAISNTFIDLQTIIPGLNTLLYGQGTFLSDQQSTNLTPTGQTYRLGTGTAFDLANTQYQTVLQEYKALSRTSATSTILQTLGDAYSLAKRVANTLQSAQNTVTFITTSQPNYLAKDASTAQSEVITWSNSINSDVSSLLSAQNSIASAENSLTNLVVGTDPLDIQSQQLSLQQAQQTYDNYFIRAPFDGTIGLIPVTVYGQAGNGTSIATIISDQMIATLSLNEVDAAKVKTSDPVSVTFNAINNFTATGTVAEIDRVGTVSSGVVAYGVKVAINTADSRILPGMSVNAAITTFELDNILTVPSTAVKASGNKSYVQVLASSTVSQYLATLAASAGASAGAGTTSSAGRTGRAFGSSTPSGFASTTGGFAGGNFGSTTGAFASSTFARGSGSYGAYAGTGGVSGATSRTTTITTGAAPTNVVVVVGQSDDTNTQIVSGLNPGDWVIVKTIVASSQTASTASAPSLLSSLGGGARGAFGGGAGGGGAARPTTAAPAAARGN